MLGSITPLGERGRGSRWWVTVTAFVVSSLAGGAAIGAALGAAGLGILSPTGLSAPAKLWALGLVLVVGLILDLGPAGITLPSPRRQVNEDWLGQFRGWVYGSAFGLQLGTGVVTVVTTSTVYGALAAAFLTASPWRGLIVGITFGLVRGATVLPGAGVTTPLRLTSLERSIRRWDHPARLTTLAVQLAVVGAVASGAIRA